MSGPSAETLREIWILTLAVYAVVLVVVALLLTLILRAARDIHEGVAAVWTVGQRIANNTIQIALLSQTNRIAGRILGSARGVVEATAAIRAHAETCPGCPDCALAHGPSGRRQ